MIDELRKIREAELKAIISKYRIPLQEARDGLINDLIDYLDTNDKPIIRYIKELQADLTRLKTKVFKNFNKKN